MGQEAPPRVLRALLVACLPWLGLVATPAEAGEARAVEVRSVELAEGGVRFDLALAEALPSKLLGELDQGERVSVTWEVELVRDRKLWFNTTVARLELRASALYDPLTKRYALERRQGKELIQSAEAGEREEALDWLTRAGDALVTVRERAFVKPRLRWRVRAILDRKLVMLFVPTTVKTSWEKGVLTEDPGERGE